MTHEEIESLLGAYALDAVPADEVDIVEQHLPLCPRCRSEVQSYRETASIFGDVGAQAPDGVWSKISGQLVERPPALKLTPVARQASWGSRPSRRPRPLGLIAAGVAAVAAVTVAVMGVRLSDQGDQLSRLEQVVGDQGWDAEAAAAAVSEDARRVHLERAVFGEGPDGTVTADVVLLPDGRGYLLHHTLPPLPGSQTYQLWGQVDDRTLSLGVLGSTPARVSFTASTFRLDALAITAEVAGGVESSQNTPVVAGAVPPPV